MSFVVLRVDYSKSKTTGNIDYVEVYSCYPDVKIKKYFDIGKFIIDKVWHNLKHKADYGDHCDYEIKINITEAEE